MTADQRTSLASLDSLAALTCTIYGEARGEPIEGQVAVGSVIRNRRDGKRFGVTFRAVCLSPFQFSCWNTNDPNFDQLWQIATYLGHGGSLETFDDHPGWRQVCWVADGILDGRLLSNVGRATHYCTKALFQQQPPKWAVGITPCATKGSQVFFEGVQ